MKEEERKTNKAASLTGLKKLFRWGLRALKWGCVFHCVREYGVWFSLCSGNSMEPTLYEGDLILVNRFIRHVGKIKRNDVIILQKMSNPNKYLCKRLVGVEGDRVFNEESGKIVKVPRGYMWIEGDNRSESNDSRSYGPVPFGLTHSKVIYKFGSGFL